MSFMCDPCCKKVGVSAIGFQSHGRCESCLNLADCREISSRQIRKAAIKTKTIPNKKVDHILTIMGTIKLM